MSRARVVSPVLATLALAVVANAAVAQTSGEIATGAKFALSAGATIRFRAVNGEATFLETPGAEAVVFYARDVPADVKIVTHSTPAGLTICAVYLSRDPKNPTECLPDGSGRLATGRIRNQSRVRFRIQVPPGVHVNASIDQGDLKANLITGDLRLYSNNGHVQVADGGGPGTIDAGTGLLGNVDALLGREQRGPAARQVKLSAVGGGHVRVLVPPGVGLGYRVTTQRPAWFDPAFGDQKTAPGLLSGNLGSGDSHVSLVVDTGISGRFVAQRTK